MRQPHRDSIHTFADDPTASDTSGVAATPIDNSEIDAVSTRRPFRQHRSWWWTLAVATLAAATLAGWLIGRSVQSPSQAAATAAPPEPSWITAAVERRVLSHTVIVRGDVAPQAAVRVTTPVSVDSQPVVTAIGVAVGDVVAEGERLVEVSGRPVFVLFGDVPIYRSLRPGMRGADVAQLQAALGRLGCPGGDEQGLYGSATKQCVADFYHAAGYDPMPSSPTEAADLAAAEQAAADAEFTLEEIKLTVSSRSPTLARAVDARDRAIEALDVLRAVTGPTIPQGEVVFVSSQPVRVGAAIATLGPVDTTAAEGADTSAHGELVRLDAGRLVVTTMLRSGDRSLVQPGMGVELLDEQSGTVYAASIASIDDTPTAGPEGFPGYPMVLSSEDPLPPELTGLNLRVTITAAATQTETLVVPLAAISSAADGTTTVSVLGPGVSDPLPVEVATGLSADGFVAVEPLQAGDLSEGDRVVVGR